MLNLDSLNELNKKKNLGMFESTSLILEKKQRQKNTTIKTCQNPV